MTPQDEIKEILIECAGSTKKTAEVLFPDRFFRPWTGLHHQIFDLLDNSDNPRKAIIAPRGIGKTSISSLLLPAKAALFVEHRYIVPISATATAAQQQSENLKYELMNNPMIRKIFGDVSTSTFNKEIWVVRLGGPDGLEICIRPRGAGQQVRGQNWRGFRPSLILPDDLEDPDHMDNEDLRKEKKEWFYNDVMESVDIYEKPITWEIILINTLLHEDSLAADIIDNPDWDVLELEICDDNLKSNIPEWWTDEDIKKKYAQKEEQHDIEGFFREFRNKPNVSGKEAPFPKKMFRYYDVSKVDFFYDSNWTTFILADPAKTANARSAKSSAIAVSVNPIQNRICVRDIVNGIYFLEEFYEEVFAMQQRVNAPVIGIEVTGLGMYATYPIVNESTKRGIIVKIEELHAKAGQNEKGKRARIKQLSPFYRSGMIEHPDNGIADVLEAQLMSFPASKYWDVMDAFGYLPEMLDRLGVYMVPKYSPEMLEADENEGYVILGDMSEKQMEKEMQQVMGGYNEYDDPLEDFRLV